ncbi:MAG: hypothetical protein ACE5Q4_03925 [Nitrosopumilus sp.]
MVGPYDSAWVNPEAINAAKLNRTTYGNGTTSERNAITNWAADRIFFDTDTGKMYYNTHVSAPTSVEWTEITPISTSVNTDDFPSSPANMQHHIDPVWGMCVYSSIEGNWWSTIWKKYLPTTLLERFTSDNWVDQDSAEIGVDAVTNYRMEIDHDDTDSTNNGTHLQLGANLSNSAWTMEFTIHFNSLTNTTTGSRTIWVGMCDIGSAGGQDSQDRITVGFEVTSGSERMYASWCNNQQPFTGTKVYGSTDTTMVANTTRYMRLTRTSSNSMSIKCYADPAMQLLVESLSQSSLSTPVDTLNYVQILNDNGYSQGGSWTAWLDNLMIWDGKDYSAGHVFSL